MMGYAWQLWRAELLLALIEKKKKVLECSGQSTLYQQTATNSNRFIRFGRICVLPLLPSVGIGWCLFLLTEHVELVFVGSWNVWEWHTVLGRLSVLVCVCRCDVNWPLENNLFSNTQPMKLPQCLPRWKLFTLFTVIKTFTLCLAPMSVENI